MKSDIFYLWIFIAAFSPQVNPGARVKVTVLYESMCPDSMRFMRKQLCPTYKDLKEFMEVDLVPFGKARYATDPWRISCQHGPYECYGNAVQGCALARYSGMMQVYFVCCVMSGNDPPAAGPECAKSLNYPYDGIEECARNEEGRQLMAKYGNRTNEHRQILKFVPTVLINDEFSQELQNEILRNLKSVICEKLGDSLPDKCR